MNKVRIYLKGWTCIGNAGFFGYIAIWIFTEGSNLVGARFDDYLLVVVNGHLLDEVTTIAEASKYAFLFKNVQLFTF